MTYANGIASAPTIRVRCTTKGCPAPAATRVTLPTLAPGVAAFSALLCTGCDQIIAVRWPLGVAEVTD